ncbi:uncharacterized protein LOC139933024 isoform X2 [Centroberyx gerrardi]
MALWCFLGCFIFTSYLVAEEAPQYRRKGMEAILIPTLPGQPEHILWKHDGDKVVEFDGSEQRAYSKYKNRVVLDWYSAELIIKDLTHQDSGRYESEVTVNKIIHYSRHIVEVIDEVAEPSISCVINDTSGSDASEVQARLLCSTEPRGPPSLMKFDWWLLEGPQPGPELSISLGGKHDDAVYSCGVSNPVSGKNATFTANTCYPDKSLVTALIVCLVILCILVSILVGIYCYWKRYKGTVQRKRTDVENQSAHGPAEENVGSPNGQTAVKQDETPMPGNTAKKIKIFSEMSAGSQRGAPAPFLPNNRSAKKKLFPPADTQTGSEHKSDEDQEKQPLLDNGATLPSTQPLALLARHGQHTEPEDNASEHEEEDADSDQAGVAPTEEKLPQTDSSSFEKRNETASVGEAEESSEEKESDLQSSSTPEQPGLKATPPEPDSNLSHEEANAQPDATESNQQEMDRPVSEHENESDTESDLEGVSEASNVPLRSPQQPQSPTQTIPDNTNNTSTFQEQADPDLEEPSLDSRADPNMTNPEQKSETKSDSDESGGHSQTDLYTAEPVEGASQHELQPADEKHEAQSGPNEEEPGEERLSEDEKELVKPSESEVAAEEKYEEEAHSESEAANVTEQETKMETDLDDKDIQLESDNSGEDLKDNPKKDQDLNKEVPLSEDQDGEMDSSENEDAKTNGEKKDRSRE